MRYEDKKETIYLGPITIEKITQSLVNKPVTLEHLANPDKFGKQEQKQVVGTVISAFLNDKAFELQNGNFIKPDKSTYVNIIINKQIGVEYIQRGYLLSITYLILKQNQGKNGYANREMKISHFLELKFHIYTFTKNYFKKI